MTAVGCCTKPTKVAPFVLGADCVTIKTLPPLARLGAIGDDDDDEEQDEGDGVSRLLGHCDLTTLFVSPATVAACVIDGFMLDVVLIMACIWC